MSVMSGSSGLGSDSNRCIDVSKVEMFSAGFQAPCNEHVEQGHLDTMAIYAQGPILYTGYVCYLNLWLLFLKAYLSSHWFTGA